MKLNRQIKLLFLLVPIFIVGYFFNVNIVRAEVCPPPNQDFTDFCTDDPPPEPSPEDPDLDVKTVINGLSSDGNNNPQEKLFLYTFPGNAGQLYKLDWQILQNDSPAPGIDYCVNSTSQWGVGLCYTVQEYEGSNVGAFGGNEFVAGGIDSLDYSYYSHLVVKLKVHQTFFNENDVQVKWTMHRRQLVDLVGTNVIDDTISPGSSPCFEWDAQGAVPQRKIFMEGPGGIGGYWDESNAGVPQTTLSGGWCPPMSFTVPGTYIFTLEVAGPARYGGPEVRTWDFSIIVLGAPPGPFDVISTSCFGWPNPQVEINISPSSGATSYTIQRRQGSGSWNTIAANLNYTQVDQFADSVAQDQTYEYRVIANNADGNTTSNNTSTILASAANCGSSGPPPPPPPPPSGSLTCSPASQTVYIGNQAYFGSSNGTTYTWSAPGSSNTSGSGANFNTSYSTTGNKTVTVTSGGDSANCSVSVINFPPPPPSSTPCIDLAQVGIVTALPATIAPGQIMNTTFSVTNNGNSWWHDGSAYKFEQIGTGQTIADINTNFNYGHLPYQVDTTGNVVWTMRVTAPTTPGNYQLTMRMVHKAGYGFLRTSSTCPNPAGPGSDAPFGDSSTQNFTVAGGVSSGTMRFTIRYTPKPLNPTFSASSSQACVSSVPTVTLNWDYTSNGAEDGFNIYRSANGTTWDFLKTVGAAVRSTTDQPPAEIRNYYWIRTHRAIGVNPTESTSPTGLDKTDIFVAPCIANLTNSSKVLSLVNGVPFNPSTTTIKDNDILTFVITLGNTGNASATIHRICDDPSNTLTLASTFSGGGSGSSGSTITQSDATCIGDGHQGPRINISGTLSTSSIWTITFNSTFSTTTATEGDPACNTAVVYYTDTSQKIRTLRSACVLTKPKAGAPTFQEVAP